jgi:uncharacterized membrane protein
MSVLTAERSTDIDAPVERCFGIVADLEHTPDWDVSIKSVRVLERDAEGRPLLVESEADAKVKTVKQTMRYSYDAPHKVSWVQEKGDMKSLTGSWSFADLGGGRTRATYALVADPGRVLGMLLRGPVEAKVKDMMLSNASDGLKAKAES